jgi:hypothetical protein
MLRGQWDEVLATIYDLGGPILELDRRERVVAVYRNHQRPPAG